MSVILIKDCPHCGIRSVAMNYQGYTRRRTEPKYFDVWFLLSCGNCSAGITAHFQILALKFDQSIAIVVDSKFAGSFSDVPFEFIELLPDRGVGNAPEGTPPRIVSYFDQAASSLANDNWDASGAMSRKCLDVATKMLARERLSEEDSAGILKAWLKNRIDLLCRAGLITSDIADLAMVIKDGGDDASHDEEPYSQEDATALLEFSKVFLTYVFTIPHMVASVQPANQEVESS